MIGDLDHVGVVLDDENRVALVAQLAEDGDEPQVVARMQADGRLVEHVQSADERRAERRREIDPLRFAARQRGRQAIQRQVIESDVAEERQTPSNFLEHLLGDDLFLLRQRQAAEKGLRLADGQRRHAIDRSARHLHVARFAAQTRAAAAGTREVSAISAEKHADVYLVFLALEPAEEPADPFVALTRACRRVVAPVDDEPLLVGGQLGPGDVEAHFAFSRGPFQLGQLSAVVRLAPRLDGALADRLRRIGDDEIHVELDDVAEAVAGRARAERVVEREQPRLRIFVGDPARAAVEALGEDDRNGIRDLGVGIRNS